MVASFARSMAFQISAASAGVWANSAASETDLCGATVKSKALFLRLRSDQPSPVSARLASNKRSRSASFGGRVGSMPRAAATERGMSGRQLARLSRRV